MCSSRREWHVDVWEEGCVCGRKGGPIRLLDRDGGGCCCFVNTVGLRTNVIAAAARVCNTVDVTTANIF